mmetsp:Transcript_40861/g.123135  ORF Transcript_40861/g.123135 Transcript_40861/m.123135 type:complete len:252 (+) Transcript_40861:316-1071(+)
MRRCNQSTGHENSFLSIPLAFNFFSILLFGHHTSFCCPSYSLKFELSRSLFLPPSVHCSLVFSPPQPVRSLQTALYSNDRDATMPCHHARPSSIVNVPLDDYFVHLHLKSHGTHQHLHLILEDEPTAGFMHRTESEPRPVGAPLGRLSATAGGGGGGGRASIVESETSVTSAALLAVPFPVPVHALVIVVRDSSVLPADAGIDSDVCPQLVVRAVRPPGPPPGSTIGGKVARSDAMTERNDVGRLTAQSGS